MYFNNIFDYVYLLCENNKINFFSSKSINYYYF
jgi:hypothetical protein